MAAVVVAFPAAIAVSRYSGKYAGGTEETGAIGVVFCVVAGVLSAYYLKHNQLLGASRKKLDVLVVSIRMMLCCFRGAPAVSVRPLLVAAKAMLLCLWAVCFGVTAALSPTSHTVFFTLIAWSIAALVPSLVCCPASL